MRVAVGIPKLKGGIPIPGANGKTIFANFAPKGGLKNAETVCGVNFNWQQRIEELPGDSPYYPINPKLSIGAQLGPGNTTLMVAGGGTKTFPGVPESPPYTAPPGFLDPQPGGYLYANVMTGKFDAYITPSFPVYFNTNQLASQTMPDDTLCFGDKPFDPFLPLNKSILFTTFLVGTPPDNPDGTPPDNPYKVVNYYYSWQWESNNTDNDVYGDGGVTLLNLPQRRGSFGCPSMFPDEHYISN